MKFLSQKNTFYTLVKPFVRFCLNNSLKVQEITEMLKEALVEIACEELEKAGQGKSISKISAITGLQRRDINNLLKESSNPTEHLNIITKVIGQWQLDKRFTCKKGMPVKLSTSGKESEFSELVKSVSADINPYAILFELERLNLITKESDKIALCTEFYELGEKNLSKVIQLLAKQKSDLICAVEENIYKLNKVPNLHVMTEYDNINPLVLPDIRKWILKKGSEFHSDVRKMLSQHDQDINPKVLGSGKGVRIAVTAFSRIEEK